MTQKLLKTVRQCWLNVMKVLEDNSMTEKFLVHQQREMYVQYDTVVDSQSKKNTHQLKHDSRFKRVSIKPNNIPIFRNVKQTITYWKKWTQKAELFNANIFNISVYF